MTRPLARALSLALLCTAACGPLALEAPLRDAVFVAEWSDRPDRTWIGARFWANRLQDWRLEDGAARCVEGRPRFGLRTLHLLTHRIDGARGDGAFRTTVRVEAPEGERADSAAGFLVGIGGGSVDPRLSAQVVGAPAEDGGVLCVLDAAGRVRIVDFETPIDGGGNWTLRQDHQLDALNELAADARGVGFGDAGPRDVHLELVGARFDGRRTLTLTARDAETGEPLSTAYLEDAPDTAFDGGVALVSHRSPGTAPAEGKPGGYAFRGWRLEGDLVDEDRTRTFGPILFVHYTVDESGAEPVLRLTAQAGPLGPDDCRLATLEIDGVEGATSALYTPDSATFHFEVVGGFDAAEDTAFEVVYEPHDADGEPAPERTQRYAGTIGATPANGEVVIGLLSCQKSFTGGLKWNEFGFWFPHADVARGIEAAEPDLLYFAGDQIYEGDVSPAIRNPADDAILDYLGKWYRHGWSFGELTRRLPAVVTPDDHDVYHGNIWGNGGVTFEVTEGRKVSAQDRGGYVMPKRFVNAVHRTQVAHLPPPADPTPLANGVTPFHTLLEWGGGSFAIVSDRMYKSPPAMVIPDASVKNGWSTDPEWNAAESADVPGAVLLGESQEALLMRWGAAPPADGVWYRALLSQTPFVNVATLPAGAQTGAAIATMSTPDRGAYMVGDHLAADMDSGGWPQTARDRAVRLMRAANAFHLAGDQHLGSTVRYGVDAFDDAGYAFASPAVANTWPRRWFPNPELRAPGGVSEDAPPYAGRYRDGFGNRMTVLAVANPRRTELEPTRLNDRGPGYGVVRVRRAEDGAAEVSFEAWPRWVDPTAPGARPYGGWPVRFTLPALR